MVKKGSSGDGLAATTAEIYCAYGLAFDSEGNLYIADKGYNNVRMVNTGIITTVAGDSNKGGKYAGDGGPAINASLHSPYDVVLDSSGNIYIADRLNNVIRIVNATTKNISAVAGNNSFGYSGDKGPATSAQLNNPYGIDLDTVGNIYIADTSNNVIRVVNASTQIISTYAGSFGSGYSGDNGPATKAAIGIPVRVAFDTAGNLYISDNNNDVIRKVDVASGNISTFAGDGSGNKFNGGGATSVATSTPIGIPSGIAFDTWGNLYIGDGNDYEVLEIHAL